MSKRCHQRCHRASCKFSHWPFLFAFWHKWYDYALRFDNALPVANILHPPTTTMYWHSWQHCHIFHPILHEIKILLILFKLLCYNRDHNLSKAPQRVAVLWRLITSAIGKNEERHAYWRQHLSSIETHRTPRFCLSTTSRKSLLSTA
jgi:hypothetical protein